MFFARSAGPIAICLALLCTACSSSTAHAQELEERIRQAPAGVVRFDFASREGACGSGSRIGFRDPRDADGVSFLIGTTDSGLSTDRDDPCDTGPLVIDVDRSAGANVRITARIGVAAPAAPGTDLGSVPPLQAARYLFAVASQGGPDASRALVAAVLADAVEVGPDLLRIVRNSALGGRIREQSAFWLVKFGDRTSVRALHPLAADPTVEEDLREQVIFALGQSSDAEDSAFLRDLYPRLTSDELKGTTIFSLAQRRDEVDLDWLLDRVLDRQESSKVREQAIFWLAERRVALAELESLYSRLESRDLKAQVVFAFSRRGEPEATRTLLRLARSEPDDELRSRAIFWLGQAAGREVTAELSGLVQEANLNREVQKQALFALAQRPREEGIAGLMEIARTHRDPEIRKDAIFWLGQSRDPRVLDFFAEVLER